MASKETPTVVGVSLLKSLQQEKTGWITKRPSQRFRSFLHDLIHIHETEQTPHASHHFVTKIGFQELVRA
jgi:hypothetical protein